MKKLFILVTRSYKYGGYCVAGFDAETKRRIRLVSSEDPLNNEIPKALFEPYNDLDILEVETLGKVPYGCQSENYLLDSAVPPIRRGRLSFYEIFNPAYLSASPALLGNGLSYLCEEEIARQSASLGLFNVEQLQLRYAVGDDGKMRYRADFLYRGTKYTGISVTDPVYRRDECAGQTIEHALVAVSLPAVPYSNGKYYKFIAKIFPITEEEAAQAVKACQSSAPRSRRFFRDFPDASAESISSAAKFLRALSDGRDPDTDEELNPSSVFSRSYAAWLRYCAEMIEKLSPQADSLPSAGAFLKDGSLHDGEAPSNGGHPAASGKKFNKKSTYLLRENIEKIELAEGAVTVSELSRRVNDLREPYGKKLTTVAIGAFFLEAGLIREENEERKQKVPTELGAEYGIASELRTAMNGVRYSILLYGHAAQQFFLDNIDHCVEVLDAPLSASSGEIDRRELPWTEEDDEALKRKFEEGAGVNALVKEFGRTPNFIRGRLNELGLNEGTEERDRSWGRWSEEEQEALLREYSAGVKLGEIARAHKRSVSAIARRLEMLGFEV